MSSVIYGRKSTTQMHFYNGNIGAAVKMLKYQNIAPAPAATHTTADDKVRKYTPRTANVPFSVDQTQSVQRRNARERNRVKQVNNSFARLRQHIPQTIIMDLTKGGGRGPHKKISKVDTLRIAVEYIRRLQDLVDDLNGGHTSTNSSSSSHININSSSNSIRFVSDTASNSSFSSSTLADSPSPLPIDSANASASSSAPSSEQLFYANAFQQHLQQQQQPFASSSLLTAETLQIYAPPAQTQIQLEAACHSPTSSFNSSMSFDSGTFEASPPQPPQQQQPPSNSASANANSHLNANLQLKFEPYDNFNLHEEDCTPDDEEILDYISLWQEQ